MKMFAGSAKGLWVRAVNWKNGWRQDYEGWWTRARRAEDEDILGESYRGFVTESSVSVMVPEDCYALDKGERP